MKFDDFNYEVYNPYIMIPEDKNRTKMLKEDKEEGNKDSTDTNNKTMRKSH